MRTTGMLHLGHLHGVIKNWIELQNQYDCYFFAADIHALTTHYNETADIEKFAWSTLVDWIACGLNPNQSTIYIQSHVPQHAELHLLLSMITPLSWLERVPTYKEQQQKLNTRDLSTYGFLGYPLLQAADVLIYKTDYIPVGEDQVPHIEFAREVARRFNHIYGTEPDFEAKVLAAIKKMSKKHGQIYLELCKNYKEHGKHESLPIAKELILAQNNLSITDKERLLGSLEGTYKTILAEPQALLTKNSKMPGLDGQKMSKSYNNTIMLRDPIEIIDKKIKTMPTDPARVKRTDPGTPEKCPVWAFHQVYSSQDTKNWVQEGCTQAKIGCLDCKKPIVDSVVNELKPIQDRILELDNNPKYVKEIAVKGAEKARDVAKITLDEVKALMGLSY
jgi:tryptophanyl-tRNA synthetase